MIGYKHNETPGGGKSSYMHLQMASQQQRRDTSPLNNGTNELIANMDHELLDIRVRALKCLLRKLEYGIVTSDSLKDRVDLVDRCRRWLVKVHEAHAVSGERGAGNELRLDQDELEGVELLIQLLCTLAKQKEFRDLLRKNNLDSLLSKFQPYLVGDYHKSQLAALLNSILVGQYELSYEGSPSEWYDNKTCPLSSHRQLDMFGSFNKPYSYRPYGEDSRSSPVRGAGDSGRSSPPPDQFSKSTSIPLGNEDGWVRNIQFFVPSVSLTGTDKRVLHSTVDSLSGSNDSLVLMTVTFIRDTLIMDFPSELFIQETSLILALAQVTVSKWSDRKIPFTAIQTLLRLSNFLRFRFTQLNSSEHYEVPTASYEQLQKANNLYYDYDGSYSSRRTPKSGPSNSTPNDVLVENFVQLFKNLSRSLLYCSNDLHLWPVFDSFAFTLLKCVMIFPVDMKALTMSLQGVLMELAHIWERKNDFHTTVGLCLVSTSILRALKLQNEVFIVSTDVRNMLKSLSYSPIMRKGWPEICEYLIQFASFFDPAASAGSTNGQQRDSVDGESPENNPKSRMLKLLYAIQNASSHDEVFNSVDSLRDVLSPLVFNSRLGIDSLSQILQDVPWRDTFYRFLCVEPRTEGDEDLLSRVLDLFTFILHNVTNAGTFKWITPLCCEKSCTTLKLLGSTAIKNEMRYGGTALADLLRSLLDFYEGVLKHGDVLATEETKWELFQSYGAILHSLEQSSYSNFALLGAITKCLAYISPNKSIQTKLKENPVMPVALLHRLTDAVMVLEANGSLVEGFKNTSALYYLSVCICHMLIPIMQNENYKNFNNDWVDRCGRTFHILAPFPDSRIKSQAFQLCEIMTSNPETKRAFTAKSFKDSVNSILELAYSAFIEPKHSALIKFRAGNVIWNLLNDEDEKIRYKLVKILQNGFPVLVDLSRLLSHALWASRLSVILNDIKVEDRIKEIAHSSAEGIPFITPKVLTILCKILMSFMQSLLLNPSELDATLHDITSSGICQMMFRLVLNHPLKTETDCLVWLDCCCSLSTVVEALVHLSKLDKTIPTILIGEKKCLSTMFGLLELEVPVSPNGSIQEKLEVSLNALCGNILTFGTILCCDAGNNFEDLERVAWSQQEVLFTKLTNWLNVTVPVQCRKCAINFAHAFLSVLSRRTKSQKNDPESQSVSSHPFLCRSWKEEKTYGQVLCENLISLLQNAVDTEERIASMKSLTALFNLSSSSVCYAVEDNDLVRFSVRKLQGFGNKYFETKGSTFSGKKNTNSLKMETLCSMQLLSSLFYVNSEAKIAALKNNFPDVLHKIFGWWSHSGDLLLLHAYVEALLNFTEKFPEGALALTLTSNILGVGPRRVPTQQSIFIEILGILEKELANVESNNPNLKTIEIIFELLKNICFVQECRNILIKSPAVLFLRKLHLQETKKWGNKQNTAKANYLDFLVHASVNSDVQNCIAKIPEGLEILIQLAEADNPPCSILALKVLRNLSFNSSNRGRLLTENMFMQLLSHKLLESSNIEEIEHTTVSLWALIANYEKGKLTAKKAYCVEGIAKALERLRKLEQTTNSEEDFSRVISLLETVQRLLGNTNNLTSRLSSSRSSSESQL